MSRLFAIPVCLALFACTPVAAAVETFALSPFASQDKWSFVQKRSVPGKPDVSNTIDFKIMSAPQNGQVWLAWAQAITKDGQVIWKPIDSFSSTICVNDFVGRSVLKLANSCRSGLSVSQRFEVRVDSNGFRENVDYEVVGVEEVETAAGRFQAVKIYGTGMRIFPNADAEQIAVTYWFAPKMKAMVRALREYHSPLGKLVLRIEEDLVAGAVK